MNFETERLICRSLTLDEYAIFEKDGEPDWSTGGYANPHKHLIEGPSPLPFRISRVAKDPEFVEIGIVVAFEKSTQEMVGSAGFHDWPNNVGMIEIGFGIVPTKQNKGFGKELLNGMWREIIKRDDVKLLRYSVSPSNTPSRHIIATFDFPLIGEQIDDEDGVELIFEISASRFAQRFSL